MFLLTLLPFFVLPNQCEQIMCVAPPIEEVRTAESYLLKKTIRYVYGGNGPVEYDCGGVLTEAYRHIGYRGEKISSNIDYCFKDNGFSWYQEKLIRRAQPGDVLVNKNIGQRHVALITSKYNRGSVTILDYVEKNTIASYRRHSFYEGIKVVDKNCLFSIQ